MNFIAFQFSQGDGLVLHFDGKTMLDLTGSNKVDRLPIVVTQHGIEHLLGVPKLQSGTGKEIANAIIKVLKEWGLMHKIQAICFDTTSANTGKDKGAAVILEDVLKRSLLYLPCRHHIFEIILKEVFSKLLKSIMSGPDVPIFKRFKDVWSSLNKDNFKPCITDKNIAKYIDNEKSNEIIDFCKDQLKLKQTRDDYREFLELMILFLGGNIPKTLKFAKDRKFAPPGPIHHARWMAKAIYSMKIFLFREQLRTRKLISNREENGFRDVCVFLALLYIKAWYGCKSAIHAPHNDLNFIKLAIDYATINIEVSNMVLKKISNHLWYLSDEALGFSFFDSSVPIDIKKKMVEALNKYATNVKKVEENAETIKQKYKHMELNDFVTANTMNFFDRFEITTDFLLSDPETWTEREDFKEGLDVCRSIQVVNDIAERAVQMITKYNRTGTKVESDLQYMLQVIREYNSKYSSVNRSVLA